MVRRGHQNLALPGGPASGRVGTASAHASPPPPSISLRLRSISAPSPLHLASISFHLAFVSLHLRSISPQEAAIPADLVADDPKPAGWDAGRLWSYYPLGGSSCPGKASLGAQNLVLNMAFCGQWAGSNWIRVS